MNYIKRFDPDTISNDVLLDELKKLSETLRKTPSKKDMKDFGDNITKRYWLYRERFGSLQNAQKLIGLTINLGGFQLEYSDKELLDEILNIKNKVGHTPTQDEIDKHGKYPIGAYKRHFGTYNKSLHLIGIDPNIQFGISAEEIKNDILRVSKALGRTPKSEEFTLMSKTVCSMTACAKISGGISWNNTLKKCGLVILNNKNITDDELKQEIIRVGDKVNRVPGYYDMVHFGNFSPVTYAIHFGSYIKALDYFGFDYIPPESQLNNQRTKGKDGTLYKSKFESSVANVLLEFKKDGIIKDYQYEKRVCEERQWTCDFYIDCCDKKIWLEADGMGKNRPDRYDEENEKIQYYKDNLFDYRILVYNIKRIEKEIYNLLF